MKRQQICSWHVLKDLGRQLFVGLALSATLVAACAAPAAGTQPQGRLRWGLDVAAGSLEVGTPIELRLEVWVSNWFQAPVEFPDTLSSEGAFVEQVAGSPDSRFEELNGRRWTGLIRRYRVLPLQPGPVSVALPAPLLVQAGGADGRWLRLGPPKPLLLTVKLPSGAEGIEPFVAARRLELRQRWQPEASPSTQWQVGDLVQRDIELDTDSTSPWLPEPEFGQPAGTRVRVRAPSLQERRANSAATPGLTRQHQASYQLTQAGEVSLPAVEFVWWDLQQRRKRITRLDGLTLTVHPAVGRPDPFAEPSPAGDASAIAPEPFTVPAWATAAVALALGLAWLLRRRGWRLTAPLQQVLGNRYARYLVWQQLSHACKRHDGEAAAHALTSILMNLSAQEQVRWRSDASFQAAVNDLGQWRFGAPHSSDGLGWRGDPLWAAVCVLRRKVRTKRMGDALPDLSAQ